MNLSFVQNFLTLAQAQNFSAAAKTIGISQPSLSRQIQVLEREMGGLLFIRSKRQVTLTALGNALRTRMGSLVADFEAAVLNVRGQHFEVFGSIKIGCLAELGRAKLAPLLADLLEKNPHLDWEIFLAGQFELSGSLRRGELDAAITSSEIDDPSIKSIALCEEEVKVFSSAQNKNDLNDPAKSSFAAFRKQDPLLTQYLKRFHPGFDSRQVNQRFIVNSHEAMVCALVSSQCYAVLPVTSAAAALASDAIRVASGNSFTNKLYLCLSKDFLKRQKGQFLSGYLLAQFR